MSLGGLSVIGKVRGIEVCGGLHDDCATAYQHAEMSIEGRLVEFSQMGLRLPPPSKQQHESHVFIDIEFENGPFEPYDPYCERSANDRDYIGQVIVYRDVQVLDTKTDWVIKIRARLDISLLSPLLAFGDREVVIEPIVEMIDNPTDRERTDHVVARVTRIYFSHQVFDELTF
ncbi:MAG: hypothetical protein M1283_02620 [Gammaproteobacteria bacterium]|nr:hypothetical protein [Gammaproteobacteria bacterium]